MSDKTSNDDDKGLFRRALDDARPLKADKRAPDYKPRPAPKALFSRAEDRQVLTESITGDFDEIETGAGEAIRFQRPHVGKRTMRQLARGSISVQSEVDLHGMTVPEARETLGAFLDASTTRGYTCVRIIHGKGLGSGERGPILKGKVNAWLRKSSDVLAFVSAIPAHGGTGAVYVLLSR